MRIVYALLSPTFGMHQYTADLANRMAGHEVHLVTSLDFPRDRYAPFVRFHPIARTTNTGLSSESLRASHFRQISEAIARLEPDLVHFTGPHLWNVPLVRRLRARGTPVVHTIHDLDPHHGTRFGLLLNAWNRLIIRAADQIVIHGDRYRERLVRGGLPASKVTYTPITHLFLSHEQVADLEDAERRLHAQGLQITYDSFILFFGRLERYKGVDHLLTAFAQLQDLLPGNNLRLILAGTGAVPPLWSGNLPPGVELRNRLIGDDEALDLFRRCSLLVLPYVDATQSALVAAAYFFYKPVVVTRAGALEEYVEEGVTGYVAEPGHPPSLARLLAAAVADPGRLEAMGRAGRAWYERHRAEETTALLQLYENVQTFKRSNV